MPLQAYHGGGSLKAGRSELGYSQAASVAKDSFLEDDALLKDDDPSAPRPYLKPQTLFACSYGLAVLWRNCTRVHANR